MEFIQGRIIKQCLCLCKRSHNSAVFQPLNTGKVHDILNYNGPGTIYNLSTV